MSNGIEIGEYVKTKKGRIGKLIDADKKNDAYYLDCMSCVSLENIEKHRKNLTDLIEVGDYVNGEYVYKITPGCIYFRGKAPCNKTILNIKTIVTKELFESVEYKVGV